MCVKCVYMYMYTNGWLYFILIKFETFYIFYFFTTKTGRRTNVHGEGSLLWHLSLYCVKFTLFHACVCLCVVTYIHECMDV